MWGDDTREFFRISRDREGYTSTSNVHLHRFACLNPPYLPSLLLDIPGRETHIAASHYPPHYAEKLFFFTPDT